jgi:type IV pilus assembly protein PilV
MPIKTSQSGFSLIEILVAVLVVSIGLVGLAGMQLVGLKGNQQSFSKNQAAHHTQSLLERMRGNSEAVANGDYTIDTAATSLNCSAGQPINCNDAASNCTAAQIADYDIYQAFCGSQSSSSGGIRGDLSSSQLKISCIGSCVTGDVSIDISWNEQVLGKESTGGDTVSRSLKINTRISQ